MTAAASSASSASPELVRARLAPAFLRTALSVVQEAPRSRQKEERLDAERSARQTARTAPARSDSLRSPRSGFDLGRAESGNARTSFSSRVELSARAQQEVARLKRLDSEVRAHEAAHMAAGSGLTGGASYSYATGPDGRRYAIGGEVSINTSRTGSPELDIERAARIRRAALAPATPSSQDLAVAAAANRMEQQARAELAAQQRDEQQRRQDEGSRDGWLARAYRLEPAGRGLLLDTRA